MVKKIIPRYPIYIPSKGRYENCLTAKCLIKDDIPFYLVVELQEADEYRQRYNCQQLLILPWQGNDKARRKFSAELGIENGGLIAARNWIREHAVAAGYKCHWQIDDNIRWFYRRYKGKRIRCNAGIALTVTEDFVDRYENIGIAGLNYEMFALENQKMPPFYLNGHVYSCMLFLNQLPYKWRLIYNDDTDICLQVLAGGWCTVLINAYLIKKVPTMTVKGGNTDDLYQGDGRLKMARSLERLWPGIVKTGRRFRRPQHIVSYSWRKFDTPLKLKPGVSLDDFEPVNEYGMQLMQVADEVKSPELRQLLEEQDEPRKKVSNIE